MKIYNYWTYTRVDVVTLKIEKFEVRNYKPGGWFYIYDEAEDLIEKKETILRAENYLNSPGKEVNYVGPSALYNSKMNFKK